MFGHGFADFCRTFQSYIPRVPLINVKTLQLISDNRPAIELPSPRKLALVRPDLSARETTILISEHAPEDIRRMPVKPVSAS
jgi:hypothetical protein